MAGSMLGIDSLVVIGIATLNIGTIKEDDGIVSHSFWLRNDSHKEITLIQGYTSCGCTTIDYRKDTPIVSGDSTLVSLHFNPRGKGGEFYESGTVVYDDGKRHFVHMALEGICVTSEETLLRQYPILITEGLRLSANRFDVGYMSVGESKQRNVSVLHQQEDNRREPFTIDITITDDMPKGLQHITRDVTTMHLGKAINVSITFDVYIK